MLFGSVKLKTGDVGLTGFGGGAEHITGTNPVGSFVSSGLRARFFSFPQKYRNVDNLISFAMQYCRWLTP